MISDKIKYITSLVLILIGIGLCIGGAFFTPLITIGAPILTAGLSLLGVTFATKEAPTVIFRSRRSPRAAPPQPDNSTTVEPRVITFSNNYHPGIDNRAPTRPNTPSDDDSFETARDSSPRTTLANR